MIADAHCHAWRRWPYDTRVPDPGTRGSVDALLYEMDAAGVGFAAIVCARIGAGAGGDGFGNEHNNDDVAEAVRRHPDRLTAWIDLDCSWRDEYHTPGAAERLQKTVERTGASGFTHYLRAENDGWWAGDEADGVMEVATELGLIASIAASETWFDDLSRSSGRHPAVPVLLHHLGGQGEAARRAVLRLAENPSIGVKVSGFNYSAQHYWDYPYPELAGVLPDLADAFGMHRLYWGSDFPASRDQLTYRQSLEVVREHGGLDPASTDRVMGDNLMALLQSRTVPTEGEP